ncbi:MAG TPA: sigma 54-interacting transcriptional regulator [Spongiibacteraceae bacterium]
MPTPYTEHAQINDALILEATRILTKATPTEQKIVSVLRLLSEWAQLYYGRVLLPNYSANALQPAYSYGLNRERLLRGDYSVAFDQGLTGAVWRTGQLALVTNVMDEPIFLTRIAEPIDGKKTGVGFISVPIIAEGKAIGVLSVQRRSDAPRLHSQDIDLLRVLASMIGSALLLMCQPVQYHVSIETLTLENDRLHRLCAANGIIGNSPALLAAVKQIDNAKNSDAPILLLGESGTGKEMFAAMTHKLSQREHGPYIPLNCAAIPDQLLESELFGHEKGSFTGAHKNKKGKLQQAAGGTLFLDEIGDMPLDLQVKLLRVLQDRQVQPVGSDYPVDVDFRIITATHVNLKQAVESGRFRLDLFFRLNVMPVLLPPLRDRRSDIPLLTQYFLDRYQGMYRRQLSFTAGVMERLQSYLWPGNIRQLQNVLERAVLQAEGSLLSVEQIETMLAHESELHPQQTQHAAPPQLSAVHSDKPVGSEIRYRPYVRVASHDREQIMTVLKRTGGNQTRAAELLGMTLRQLRYRLAKLA